MIFAAAAGRATKVAWLPDTSTVAAFARCAIMRTTAGGTSWSSLESRYQDGSVWGAQVQILPLYHSANHSPASLKALRALHSPVWFGTISRNPMAAAFVRQKTVLRESCGFQNDNLLGLLAHGCSTYLSAVSTGEHGKSVPILPDCSGLGCAGCWRRRRDQRCCAVSFRLEAIEHVLDAPPEAGLRQLVTCSPHTLLSNRLVSLFDTPSIIRT